MAGPWLRCRAEFASNIYVSDIAAIRKIDRSGWVSTFAGSFRGFANGTVTARNFLDSRGLCVDTNGNVLAVDSGIICKSTARPRDDQRPELREMLGR